MKRTLKWLLILGILAGGVAAAVPPVRSYWRERNRPKFVTEKVRRGSLSWEVLTTGKVEPVQKVTIGAFVSGPIVELRANFNQWVEKDELLAKVDPRIYQAAVHQNEAVLATARAEVQRVAANLQQAKNDEQRAKKLRQINAEYISDTEMDQFRFARQALEAQLIVAEQSVAQAEASLQNSQANLKYTDILAPTSGTIIDCKIESGQTIAAQFQVPELFVIAPDMHVRMWINASVVEADIGHIIRAKEEDRPVEFTVDAYEDELFHGKIREVRQNPTTEQNVVTYPVIVETPNKSRKLLPGMTANLSFEIDKKEDVILVPGAAIRWIPDEKLVRPEDKKILEGLDQNADEDAARSASDRVAATRRRRTRHVWVQEGDQVRGIEIEFGITDGQYYELVRGELSAGMELITGVE
jgi:HlyD family secretion protein